WRARRGRARRGSRSRRAASAICPVVALPWPSLMGVPRYDSARGRPVLGLGDVHLARADHAPLPVVDAIAPAVDPVALRGGLRLRRRVVVRHAPEDAREAL